MEETATYLFNGLQVIASVSIPLIIWFLNRIFKLLDRQNKWMQKISDNDIRQDGELKSLDKTTTETISTLDKTREQVFENKDEIIKMMARNG